MADNINVTPGTGKVVGTDEVTDDTLGTVQIQVMKMMDGTLGSTNKLIVSAAGAAKVDGSDVTQPVSGTVAATQSGAWTVSLTSESIEIGKVDQGPPNTLANAWPVELSDGTNLLGISAHPIRIDPTGTTTQPVSGTITANAGTGTFAISAASLPLPTGASTAANQTSVIGSAAAGTAATNSLLSGGQFNTVLPTLTNTQQAAIQLDSSGRAIIAPLASTSTVTVVQPIGTNLHTVVDSGTITLSGTSPVSGTITANQGTPNSLANGWPVELSDGINLLGVTAHPVRIDPTGTTTQPISGTVTANAGTNLNTSALALDATLTGGTQQTKIVQGGNTAIVDAAGDLQVDVNNFPATTAVTQSTSPWVENISQFGGSNVVTGTGASGAGIPRVTIANDSNILATQSGTWTVQPGNTANTTPWLTTINQGGNSAAVNATNELLVTDTDLTLGQASTTSGQLGPLVQGAVTTAAPTYTTAQTNPLSLTTAGALRTDSSATTQPISGTVTANAGTGTFSENLAQVGGNAVSTAAAGVQKVGISGATAVTLDAAQNAAAPANELIIGGVYQTTIPALVAGNASQVQVDSTGSQYVNTECRKQTYSVGVIAFTPIASSTAPTIEITGSATKTVRINRINFSASAATGSTADVIIRRFSTLTGGTSASQSANFAKWDTNNAAATAAVNTYSVAATTATSAGIISSQRYEIVTAGVTVVPGIIDVNNLDNHGGAIVLRGTSDFVGICISAVGTTPLADCWIEWTEE